MYSAKEIYQGVLRGTRKKIAKSIGKHFPERYMTELKNPVFIIGSGRGGTSMLTILLRNHRDICSFSEANEIWDPEGYPWYSSKLDRPPIWYDPIKYIEVWRQYFDEKYQNQLKGVFGYYQKISHKKIFLNKSPMNTFRIPDILEIFPNPKFVHIIRDGRAVSYSWAIKQFAAIKKHEDVFRNRGFYYPFNELISFTANSWVKHIEEVRYQKKKLNLIKNGIFIEFIYEDFCKNPEKYVNKICNFLSIDRKRLAIDSLSHIKSMNYKWKENLDEDIISNLNMIVNPVMEEIQLDLGK